MQTTLCCDAPFTNEGFGHRCSLCHDHAEPINHIIACERRVRDTGQIADDRRATQHIYTTAANANLATAKLNLRNAMIGLVLAFIFAAVVMMPVLTDNEEVAVTFGGGGDERSHF